MLRLNVIRTGFLMGLSLLLGAIIYFFAANWGGLDRPQKIIASAGIIVLFYGVSFAFMKFKSMLGHHAFLSAIFLVGGCISFGAAVALLNQIYNSHADNYELFLVWAIPALLLAWITRYNPFYVLSYILLHLALWFLFFPSSLYVVYSDGQILMIGSLFALINLILFVLTEMKRLESAPLRVLSFLIFHVSLLTLTNSFEYESYGVWMNIICIAAIGIGFYIFIRIKLNKTMLTLNALAASAFAVFKFIELASRHASTLFFIFGLLFVALLLTANVYFFRYLNKLGAGASVEEENTVPHQASDSNKSQLVGKIVSAIVTVIGILIGSISLIGLVLLASNDIEPQYTLFALSLVFVIPVILLPRVNAVIRYTVLTIGYAAGLISIAWIDMVSLSCVFLLLTAAGWLRLNGRKQHLFTYALININIAIILFELLESVRDSLSIIVLILAALHAAAYACTLLLKEGDLKQHVRESSLFFTLLFLFWLTFLNDLFPYSYELFNALNFIVTTALVFVYIRRNQALEATLSLVFWFIFLAFKYYDLLWTLLHKSITLALLGLIFIAVTYLFARRTDAPEGHADYGSFMRKSPVLILIVILLQLGYLGYHTAASEHVLKNGTSIKLEIEPLDPRSLLQGDYVTLNYSISTPPDAIAQQLEQRRSMKGVKVVLAPDDRGVYTFNRLYASGDTLAGNEVVINGKHSGWNLIYYGIETFYVPEGTGVESEQNARFAYIKVSANGDAMLEKLSKQQAETTLSS